MYGIVLGAWAERTRRAALDDVDDWRQRDGGRWVRIADQSALVAAIGRRDLGSSVERVQREVTHPRRIVPGFQRVC